MTVAANTVAIEGRRRRSDPFTLVSGESISPQVDASATDIEGTDGSHRYEPGPVIGAGGMGEVRLHTDRRIGRRVAKKTLHAALDSQTARQRFLREVRVQGQLEHPAIVPVYDLDVDEQGQVFFTMKRVRGNTLERVLDRLREGDAEVTRRFSPRKLLTAFAQVCLAIDYAHTRGVLHRDIKPGNIMLGDFGEVYMLDWGLAKVIGEADDDADAAPESARLLGASTALTRGGALLGTPAYMAPEQLLRKTDQLDARSDVFALGAILFEIVTRSQLRVFTEVPDIVRRLHEGESVRPSDRVPDVAPELDEICARALANDPEERPARARDLAEAVERFLDGEQDASLRKELAAKHAAAARRRAAGLASELPPASDLAAGQAPDSPAPAASPVPPARVEAFRETLKALALDADNADAQKLLVDLLTDVSGEVPEEARRALSAAAAQTRRTGARMGTQGILLWLAILPVMILIGVRSWPVVITTAVVTGLAGAFAHRLSKQPSYGIGGAAILAALVAGVVGLTSCYLGPFTVVPTCAATASILFAMHATRRERPLLTGIVALGALAPFVAEILGIFPRAYAFEADRIVVFARAAALPAGATHGAMIYSTLSFIILAAVLMGRMRDALLVSEQRHFLQAWYLRKLFPAGEQAG
jgi:tRNA A-37 threonylcarbamoyl transferase component Bud32